MRVGHKRTALVLALAATLLVGCAIGADDSPRDIDSSSQDILQPTGVAAGGEATGSARIYLLAPSPSGETTSLEAVARDIADDPDAIIRSLLDGPNQQELSDQFRTALPDTVQLNSTRLGAGGVLDIDLSAGLAQLSGDALIAAVAQIVFTASGVDGVRSVELTVDGSFTQWPAGNGELQSDALTVYDYPSVVRSGQPPYPAIPSPTNPPTSTSGPLSTDVANLSGR